MLKCNVSAFFIPKNWVNLYFLYTTLYFFKNKVFLITFYITTITIILFITLFSKSSHSFDILQTGNISDISHNIKLIHNNISFIIKHIIDIRQPLFLVSFIN